MPEEKIIEVCDSWWHNVKVFMSAARPKLHIVARRVRAARSPQMSIKFVHTKAFFRGDGVYILEPDKAKYESQKETC